MTDRDDVRRLMTQLGTPAETYQVFDDEPQTANLSRWTLLESVAKAGRSVKTPVRESHPEDVGPRISELVAHLVSNHSEIALEASASTDRPVKATPFSSAAPQQKPVQLSTVVDGVPSTFASLFKRPDTAPDSDLEPSGPVATGNSLKQLLKTIGT
ncbi:hypothetical protein [Pseudomonas sp. Marseille-QA0892]